MNPNVGYYQLPSLLLSVIRYSKKVQYDGQETAACDRVRYLLDSQFRFFGEMTGILYRAVFGGKWHQRFFAAKGFSSSESIFADK